MEDPEIDLNELIARYQQLKISGKSIYLDADEFAILADYYSSEGNLEESISIIDTGLRIHPCNQILLLIKAKQRVFSEDYIEALSLLEEISESDEIEYYLLFIECYLNLNRKEDAYQLIDDTLNSDLSAEDFYNFITEMGFLLNDFDDYDRAIIFFEKSLAIDDANIDVLTELTYSYDMKLNFDKAIEYNNRLLDLEPYSFEGWVNLGNLYSVKEEYNKAIDAFDFALTISENNVQTMKMKALILILSNNPEEGINLLKKCIDLSPDDESIYDSLLEAYETLNKYDEMSTILDRKELRFGRKGVAVKRAYLELIRGNLVDAKKLFDEIDINETNGIDFYLLEGEIAFSKNDLTTAESAFMKAAILSGNDETIIDKLVNISVARGKYTQAEKYLEDLLKSHINFPTVNTRLAFVRFEIGQTESFNEVVERLTDSELRSFFATIMDEDESKYAFLSRENLIARINEARENRILFKNIKY